MENPRRKQMTITDDIIERVKEATDILELVGQTVELKKRGDRKSVV